MAETHPTQSSEPAAGAAAPSRSGPPTLELMGISKSFGAVHALTNVDFEVYSGEVVGLVGDNGAGKSTLVKVIAGVHTADKGEIYLEGRRVHIGVPHDANRLGIETVYQDLALADNLDVVANLFLGREERTTWIPWLVRPLNELRMESRALDVLRQLQVTTVKSVRQPVASLSGGQRQSIAVAKTILRKAKIVLLDEPTAALGIAQTRQVLNLIKRLREQGLAVVVISHNLADIFEVVDRVIVLRLGRRAATFDIGSTTPEQVVAAITGAQFGELLSGDSAGPSSDAQEA